jgi:hypothetical protein
MEDLLEEPIEWDILANPHLVRDTTVFGSNVSIVELFGNAESLVWSRNTLYTPSVKQPFGSSNVKSR